MKTVHSLIELQRLEFGRSNAPGRAQAIERLRAAVPEDLLARFDRVVQRGRKAVAFVNGRTCSECHIQLPIGVMADILAGNSAERCPNCGRFIVGQDVLAEAGTDKSARAKAASQAQD